MGVEKAYLLNFGALLSDGIIKAIKKDHDISNIEQVHIRASLNLKKHSTYIQVHDIVEKNKDYFCSGVPVIINLPGLPVYVAHLLTEISALTSKLPVLVECVKDYDSDGIFSDFKYKRLYDLDRERSWSRENYKRNPHSRYDDEKDSKQ